MVRRVDDQLWVALIREGRGPMYVLPKGRLERGESIQQAAIREIEEEAGLSQLTLLADLGVRERLNYSRRRWKKVYYFLFLTRQITGHPTDRYRSYELSWFPIHRLPDMFWPEQKALIEINREMIRSLVLHSPPSP